MQRRVALIGASGYTGIEVTRLLASHPSIELAVASSDRWVGESIEARTGTACAGRYVGLEEAVEKASTCEVVMLATPAEASHELAPRLLAAGPRVIDLSGAFRLRDAALYPKYYGFEHKHRDLLKTAFYGLPELYGPDRAAFRRDFRLIANPGCYATAIQLALCPLLGLSTLAHGDASRIIVDAMSGVTGAGRKAAEEYSFAEIAGDLRAYRALRHQHQPEIEQGLNDMWNEGATHPRVEVTFVPHLLPVQRGILATCHLPVSKDTTADAVRLVYTTAFERERFITLAASADGVSLHDVVGTNVCKIGWSVSERGELVVTSAIDNLVKGAAGQAVQNLNLMLGLPEGEGLTGMRRYFP
jgi:N-acetyl-gamma-glutamyl-phosphate reductase